MSGQTFWLALLGVNLGLTACSSGHLVNKEDKVLRDIGRQQVVQAIMEATLPGNTGSPCKHDRIESIVCYYSLSPNEKIWPPRGMRRLVSSGKLEDKYMITFHEDATVGGIT